MKINASFHPSHSKAPSVPLLALCASVALIAGCTSANQSHLVSAPPPPNPTRAMTTTTTTTTPEVTAEPVAINTNHASTTTTVVTEIPPALRQEVPIAQPSSNHVWLAGYWTWQNNRYEWMSGNWQVPPNAGSNWIAPRWEKRGDDYRFYEGYWDQQITASPHDNSLTPTR